VTACCSQRIEADPHFHERDRSATQFNTFNVTLKIQLSLKSHSHHNVNYILTICPPQTHQNNTKRLSLLPLTLLPVLPATLPTFLLHPIGQNKRVRVSAVASSTCPSSARGAQAAIYIWTLTGALYLIYIVGDQFIINT
jgi:hypothetical protein